MSNDMPSSQLIKPWQRDAGTMLMVLVTLFLALDAGMKLAGAEAAIAATGQLGVPATAPRTLGLVLEIAMVLFVVPATRLLGAILVTGYLGGAVAVQALHGSPIATHVLFGVYVGLFLWLSIWLRSSTVRALIPLQRSDAR